MPDNRIMGMNTLGTPDDNDHIEVIDVSEILPSNQNKKFSFVALKNYVLTALTTPLHKNTHIVGGTDAFVVTDLLNAVAKVGIRIANILIGQRRHINFIAGTNVTITALDDNINEKVDVTINSTVAGNVGDVTGGLNVGTGENIFLDKVTNDLRFKTARGTGIVTVTTNVNNELEFNVPAPGNTVDVIQNVGTGEGVWKQTVGNVHDLKSLEGSPSVTITNNVNDLTFTANDLTTISHIGGGLQIATKTLLNTEYNTFSAGTNMSIVPTGGNYVINTTAQPNDGLNLGAGQQVFKAVNAGIPEYRTLTNGTGITLSSNANEVNIVNSLPMINNVFQFVQTGSVIIEGKSAIENNIVGTHYLMPPNYNISGYYPINENLHINGNYNKINASGLGLVATNTGMPNCTQVYFENIIFDITQTSSEAFLFEGKKVIFKNCVFNITVTTWLGSTFSFDKFCQVLFENCIFNYKSSTTIDNLISINYAGAIIKQDFILKNCNFYCEDGSILSKVTNIISSSPLPSTITSYGNNNVCSDVLNCTVAGIPLIIDNSLKYIS